MNNCKKCNKEKELIGVPLCFACKYKEEEEKEEEKEDRNAIVFGVGVLILVFCLFIGIRYAWTIYTYDDWRCMLSECRIIK